jgi:hypothetical protein
VRSKVTWLIVSAVAGVAIVGLVDGLLGCSGGSPNTGPNRKVFGSPSSIE